MLMTSTHPRDMFKKSENIKNFHPNKPYFGLPLLPPPHELESRAVLKKCITARAALAELKQAGNLLPHQEVMINCIPMLESQASSEIENIVTTTDKLFQFVEQTSSQIDPATKEALSYRTALFQGYQSLRHKPICINTAIDICSTIKRTQMEIRRVPGVSLANESTGEVIYTPPEGEALLNALLGNWERFLHEDEAIDPLVRMAVAHYQFEAIHPFTDGNGRTGRILNLLFLVEQGLLDIPVLYLSRHIIGHRQNYYQNLLAVTQNQQWEKWILYMLEAVEQTSQWTCAKIIAIHKLMRETSIFIQQKRPSIYSHEMVEVLFTQPYCRIENLVNAGIAKRQTASRYLHELCAIDVMKEVKYGREKLFIHPALLRLLTEDRKP